MGLIAVTSAQTLKIGVIAPLTGGGAPWGMAAAEGTKIAAAEINAKGGLEVGGKKYRIEVVPYDDQYKAADALAGYTRLVKQDGVKYMVTLTALAGMALKQNLEDDKVVALTAAFSTKMFDPNTKYLFRIYSIPADYLPSLVSWMKANRKERRIYLVNPNDETGWDHDQVSDKAFKSDGFEVLGRELYERTQKDFQPMFTKIIATKPDIIDLGSAPPATAGLMARQVRELGYKGVIVKTGAAAPKEVIAAAGKEAAEGMIGVLGVDPVNAGYQRIAAEYKKSVGQEPNEMILPIYDSIQVLVRAIQKAGDVNNTAKVAAAFAQALPMKSVQGEELALGGKKTIGVNQQIMTVAYVGVIKNGESVTVGKIK